MAAQRALDLPVILVERLQASAAELVTFRQRWPVEALGLFGSVLRNDFGPESDIDVLVVFESSHRQVALSRIKMKA